MNSVSHIRLLAFMWLTIFSLFSAGSAMATTAPDSMLPYVYGLKTTKTATLIGGQTAEMRINASSMRDPGKAVFKIGSTTITYEYKGKSGSSYIYHLDIPSYLGGSRTITAYTDHRGSKYTTTQTGYNLDKNLLYSCTQETSVYCTNGKSVWDAPQKITKSYETRILIAGEKDVMGAYETLSGTYSMWVDQVFPTYRRMITLAPGARASSPWGGGPYQRAISCVRPLGGDKDDEDCFNLSAYFPSEFGVWKEVNKSSFRVWKIDEDKSVNIKNYDPIRNLDNTSRTITIQDILSAANIRLGANGLPYGDFPASATRTDYKVYVKGQINSDYNDYILIRLDVTGETVGCTPATTQSISSCDSGEKAVSSLLESSTCLDSSSVKTFGVTSVSRPSSGCWTTKLNYEKNPVQICGTSGCAASRTDTSSPTLSASATQCTGGSLKTPFDMSFVAQDVGYAGLNYYSFNASIRFGDGSQYDYPISVTNITEVQSYLLQGLGVPKVSAVGNASGASYSLQRAIQDAYFNSGTSKSKLPFTITASMRDLDSNYYSRSFTYETRATGDTVRPNISISAPSVSSTLDNLAVTLTDVGSGIDPGDVNFVLEYKGKTASFNMKLAYQGGLSADACVARKPTELRYVFDSSVNLGSQGYSNLAQLIAESVADNQSFTIRVNAADWAGNTSTSAQLVKFQPVTMTESRRLPGLIHAFDGSLELPISSIKSAATSQSPVYYAYLTGGNQGVTINGVAVNTSTPVPVGALSAGTLVDFKVGSNVDRKVGTSKVSLIPGSNGYKRIDLNVDFWGAKGTVTGSNFNPFKIYEKTWYEVRHEVAGACTYTGLVNTAKASNPLSNSYCHVEWTLPSNLVDTKAQISRVEGAFAVEGNTNLVFNAYLYDTDGSKHLIENGTIPVAVKKDTTPPTLSMAPIQCTTTENPFDLSFLAQDSGPSGVDIPTLNAKVRFGDGEEFGYPLKITNMDHVLSEQSKGNSVLKVTAEGSAITASPELQQAIKDAYFNIGTSKTRLPYTIFAQVHDRDGNLVAISNSFETRAVLDKTAPAISFNGGASSTIMKNLNDLAIAITDAGSGIEKTDVAFSLEYNGESVPFEMVLDYSGELSDDACVARKPTELRYVFSTTKNFGADGYSELTKLIAQAVAADQSFTVKVDTKDWAGNAVSASHSMKFQPEVHNAKAVLPGLIHSFDRSLIVPISTLKSAPTNQGPTYYAYFASGNQGMTINGVTINKPIPVSIGQLQGDLQIDFKVSSDVDRRNGTSKVILVPSSFGYKQIELDVDFWSATGDVKGSNFQPVKIYESTWYEADQTVANGCTYTGRISYALTNHPVTNPYCHVEWTIPDNLVDIKSVKSRIEGTIASEGPAALAYKSYIYDTDGSKHFIESKSVDILVKDIEVLADHRVPGIRHAFQDSRLIVPPSVWTNGVTSGTVNYSSRMLDDGVGAKINGKTIGKTMVDGIASLQATDSLTLDLSAAREFVVGKSRMLVVPDVYPAKAIMVDLDFWTQDAEMTGANFEPVKLDEDVSFGATQMNSVQCGLSGMKEMSQASDLSKDPMCYIEWTKYPKSLEPQIQETPALAGVADNEGAHTINFLVKLADEDGSEHIIGSGTALINVKDTVVYRDLVAPGLSHPFKTRVNKRSPVNIEGEDLIFTPFEGDVNYVARILNKDSVPVTINGINVSYGQDVEFGQIGFAGNQSFDVSTQTDQVEGRTVILLIPDRYQAKAIKVTVDFWVPDTKMIMDNNNPVQLYEYVGGHIYQGNDMACDLTNQRNISINAEPFGINSVCYVRWTKLPEDVFALEQNRAEIGGYTPATGIQSFTYDVVMIDENNNEHIIASGYSEIDVIPAKEKMVFAFPDSLNGTYRILREIQSTLGQKEGPSCGLVTVDDEEAQDSSMMNRPSCLIDFTLLPDGIEQDDWTTKPTIKGSFNQREGNALFEWTLYGYTTTGSKIEIMQSSQEVELRDPPVPEITIADENLIRDSLYAVERTGGLIANYRIDALSAELIIEVFRDGETYFKDMMFYLYGDMATYNGAFYQEEERDVWDEDDYQIDVYYRAIPDIRGTKTISAVNVPSYDVRPDIKTATEVILSSDLLSVEAQMIDPYRTEDVSSAKLGEWDVSLLDYVSYSNRLPITENKRTPGSKSVNFDLDFSDSEAQSIRLLGHAKLVSPIEGYTREVDGNKPLFVTILKANPIEGEIVSRRLVGEAPLGVYAQLDIKNRLDYRALGDIVWETRDKGTEEWTRIKAFDGASDRIINYYPSGQYEMRARLFNKYSGAEFVTDMVDIHSFDIPKVTLKGPKNAFVTDVARMSIEAELEGVLLTDEDLVVEWSEDGGDTWVTGGVKYELTRNEEVRVPLSARVRMNSAPDGYESAVNEVTSIISFRPIRPPRAGIYGDRVIEKGTLAEWNAVLMPPYPDMDVVLEGRFILPDGTLVDGDLASYMPSDEDVKQKRITLKHQVWVVGFEDKGATVTEDKILSVWEYKWPNWAYYTRMSAVQAPSEISVSVRNPAGTTSYIEGLKYEWTMPEGVVLSQDRFDHTKVFIAEVPGKYTIRTTVTDDRGHSTDMSETFDVVLADKWIPEFRISPSDPNFHAPLEVRLAALVEGGHPRDRISNYRYYVNGEVMSEGERYANLELKEGDYEIALEVETEFGEKEILSKNITVHPNVAPTCKLEDDVSRFGIRFRAYCEDEDGYIARHRWMINDEELDLTGSRISLSAREDADSVVVKVKGVDNGGLETDWVIWHGSLKSSD